MKIDTLLVLTSAYLVVSTAVGFAAPPAGVTAGPPASVTMGPPASVTMGPPASVTMGPPASVTMGPPPSVTMGPPAHVTMGPPAGVTMGPPPSALAHIPAGVTAGPPAVPPSATANAASELGKLNSAHASTTAMQHAAPGSAVGAITTYKTQMLSALALTDATAQSAAITSARQNLATATNKDLTVSAVTKIDAMLNIKGALPTLGTTH